jgi:protein-tyrosine phosphatase
LAFFIDDILYGLEIGVFLPLGNSKCVLTELYPDVTPKEAKAVVEAMVVAGWKPILAHTERYPALFDGTTLQELVDFGAKIQVNLYSLVEENKDDIKERARFLVDNRLAHFVGSDAHRINYRSPKYESGVRYIEERCGKECLEELCYKNADSFV